MVVVSGSWVKNVVTYPSPAMSANNNLVTDMVMNMNNNNNNNINGTNTNGVSNNTNGGGEVKTNCAKAILISRPNSHPFQDRTLMLDQPVKVGRSVARARATPSNAIFECKVLSRHHALLWYERGKFYLQDTKSSNGTFVNNNRLSSNESEPQELSSGDIVQFGVDVVENNRKLTHGCIVATIKLYLPDGKEAKASPSITEGNRHGMVPLDELYKLNQIIQEASQRELCLENKLTALQQVVEEAKKSADDSWQAYVGEERLLSKVSALENQLTQAGKTWNDERLREELGKLQEESISYQVAAKGTLDKLHNEKLEALALLTEEQRARAIAEQEAQMARDQYCQIESELQVLARKLGEEQKKSDEERNRLEQSQKDLQARLEADAQTIAELEEKVKLLSGNPTDELMPLEQLEKYTVIYDLEMKNKEQLLGENEMSESDLNRSNGLLSPQNHINLTVGPVGDGSDLHMTASDCTLSYAQSNDSEDVSTIVDSDNDDNENSKDATPERFVDSPKNIEETSQVQFVDLMEPPKEKHEHESECYNPEHVDSKTLKYQYQSVQNELKKEITNLESAVERYKENIADLEDRLKEEKLINVRQFKETETLKNDMLILQEKFMEIRHENVELNRMLHSLNERLVLAESEKHKEDEGVKEEVVDEEKMSESMGSNERNNEDKRREERLKEECGRGDAIDGGDYGSSGDQDQNQSISHQISVEEFSRLEEELVILKEKYAQMNEEKLSLNNSLKTVREDYNALCNRNHNQMFFYIAPLVLMVLYLIISSMFS